MKKIYLSLSVIAAVAAVVVGATTAFYSDTEVSKGNTLTAGAIDLGVDNHSYYNGELSQDTTWIVDYDLEQNEEGRPEVHYFWNFNDLKPGDWGEDTISPHVNNNDSWLCADVTLTSDDDNLPTEPELDVDGDTGTGLGELADEVRWYWWNDDGDNVYECVMEEVQLEDGTVVEECNPEAEGSEQLLPGSGGNFGQLGVGNTAYVTLADSNNNIWTGQSGDPLDPEDVRFVGKAWCFGDSFFLPYAQDGGNQQSGPDDRQVQCDGSSEGNITQTDSMTADVTFRAVQSRHNDGFVCQPQEQD